MDKGENIPPDYKPKKSNSEFNIPIFLLGIIVGVILMMSILIFLRWFGLI